MTVGTTPVPSRFTVTRLPDPLVSATTVPVLVPPPVGVKRIEMVQLAPVEREAGQLFVWEKSPVIVNLTSFTLDLPEFTNVAVST